VSGEIILNAKSDEEFAGFVAVSKVNLRSRADHSRI